MKTFLSRLNLKILFLLCFLNDHFYPIDIKILIKKDTIPHSQKNSLEYSFENVKKVKDLNDPEAFYDIPKEMKQITLTYKNNDWYLNNKKLKTKQICLENKEIETHIAHEDCSYEGSIHLQTDENALYITNVVDLEKYVAAVVAKEFYSVWDANSLKIAAIITRTYATHKILKKKENSIYHLKNSIFDQHYCGYIYNEKIKHAVEETKGKIITWQKKPIMAMYHVCCGGVVPQECVGFNFEEHPYLKRKKKCTGCLTYKRYEWEINQTHDRFCDYLSSFLNQKILKIKKIIKIAHAKSGTVRRLLLELETLKQKKQKSSIQISLTNKQLRKIFNLPLSTHSAWFKLSFDKEHNITVIGKGNGHHMGLCQIGMNEYIKNGLPINEVITFYYPETEISHVEEIAFS
jgi:stage II sporulation protein D